MKLRTSKKGAILRRKVTADEIDLEVKMYPDYCNSIFYVFNVATAVKIVDAAKVTPHPSLSLRVLFLQAAKYFFIDDVFVTGFLRKELNLTLVDSKAYQVGMIKATK